MIDYIKILALCICVLGYTHAALAQGQSPSTVRPNETAFIGVKTIAAQDLAALLRTNRSVRLFDTRERAEFEVSHIPNARRLDPAVTAGTFIARVRRHMAGRTFIFYCTAAGRSRMIAEWFAQDLKKGGARDVMVLQGGIISWANSDLPLVNRNGSTRYVHPFEKEFSKLLKDKSRIRLRP